VFSLEDEMCDWVEEFPGMISVCDVDGKIMVLNKKIAAYFSSTGGKELIGTNLFDCHGNTSGEEIKQLMKQEKADVYIAEENGERELVIHSPWFKEGEFAGLVEITLPFNGEIQVRIRD
jgi:transcriptional regulator with PAS, ATPase and Fis domain